MGEVPEIRDLASVVEPFLDGARLLSYTSSYLTKPGDNYGSIMLRVVARVAEPDGRTGERHLIAKLPPLTNEVYWSIFCPERTCVTECVYYRDVLPALRRIQLEAGVAADRVYASYPRYFGSRLALDPACATVDRDAVLVLENVQGEGFRVADRVQLLDFDRTQLLLGCMAQFHALPIALRLKKSGEFDRLVRPHFRRFCIDSSLPAEMRRQFLVDIIQEVNKSTQGDQRTAERLGELFQGAEDYMVSPEPADSPYTTIIHNDLWSSNFMLKCDASGAAKEVMIVDYQTAMYESLMHDVVFFLLSSVQLEVLDTKLKTCLEIYYNEFVGCLQSVGVATDAYSYQEFWQEFLRVAPVEIYHTLNMIKYMLISKSDLPEDFKDMDATKITENRGSVAITQKLGQVVALAKKYNIFY